MRGLAGFLGQKRLRRWATRMVTVIGKCVLSIECVLTLQLISLTLSLYLYQDEVRGIPLILESTKFCRETSLWEEGVGGAEFLEVERVMELAAAIVDGDGTVGGYTGSCLLTFVASWVTNRVAQIVISINAGDKDMVRWVSRETMERSSRAGRDKGVFRFVAGVGEVRGDAEEIEVALAVRDLQADGCESGLPVEDDLRVERLGSCQLPPTASGGNQDESESSGVDFLLGSAMQKKKKTIGNFLGKYGPCLL